MPPLCLVADALHGLASSAHLPCAERASAKSAAWVCSRLRLSLPSPNGRRGRSRFFAAPSALDAACGIAYSTDMPDETESFFEPPPGSASSPTTALTPASTAPGDEICIDPELERLLSELGIQVGSRAPAPPVGPEEDSGSPPSPDPSTSFEVAALVTGPRPPSQETAIPMPGLAPSEPILLDPGSPVGAIPTRMDDEPGESTAEEPANWGSTTDSAAPADVTASAEDTEGGVDRAFLMDSLEQFIEDPHARSPLEPSKNPPTAASRPASGESGRIAEREAPAIGGAAPVAAPRHSASPSDRRSNFDGDGLMPVALEKSGRSPMPEPPPAADSESNRAPALSNGVRKAWLSWRFLRLPGIRTQELDQVLRELQVLVALTIGIVWLLVAYLTRHPVPTVFAALFIFVPLLVLFDRMARRPR